MSDFEGHAQENGLWADGLPETPHSMEPLFMGDFLNEDWDMFLEEEIIDTETLDAPPGTNTPAIQPSVGAISLSPDGVNSGSDYDGLSTGQGKKDEAGDNTFLDGAAPAANEYINDGMNMFQHLSSNLSSHAPEIQSVISWNQPSMLFDPSPSQHIDPVLLHVASNFTVTNSFNNKLSVPTLANQNEVSQDQFATGSLTSSNPVDHFNHLGHLNGADVSSSVNFNTGHFNASGNLDSATHFNHANNPNNNIPPHAPLNQNANPPNQYPPTLSNHSNLTPNIQSNHPSFPTYCHKFCVCHEPLNNDPKHAGYRSFETAKFRNCALQRFESSSPFDANNYKCFLNHINDQEYLQKYQDFYACPALLEQYHIGIQIRRKQLLADWRYLINRLFAETMEKLRCPTCKLTPEQALRMEQQQQQETQQEQQQRQVHHVVSMRTRQGFFNKMTELRGMDPNKMDETCWEIERRNWNRTAYEYIESQKIGSQGNSGDCAGMAGVEWVEI